MEQSLENAKRCLDNKDYKKMINILTSIGKHILKRFIVENTSVIKNNTTYDLPDNIDKESLKNLLYKFTSNEKVIGKKDEKTKLFLGIYGLDDELYEIIRQDWTDYFTSLELIGESNAENIQEFEAVYFYEKMKSIVGLVIEYYPDAWEYGCIIKDVTRSFDGKVVSIKSNANHKYVTCDEYKDYSLFADRDVADAWEKFTINCSADGWAYIRAWNGKQTTVKIYWHGKNNPLAADTDNMDLWEKFKIFQLKDDIFFIYSYQTEKWLSNNNDPDSGSEYGRIMSYVRKANGWESFNIELV